MIVALTVGSRHFRLETWEMIRWDGRVLEVNVGLSKLDQARGKHLASMVDPVRVKTTLIGPNPRWTVHMRLKMGWDL